MHSLSSTVSIDISMPAVFLMVPFGSLSSSPLSYFHLSNNIYRLYSPLPSDWGLYQLPRSAS